MKLAVLIPTYNESKNIGLLLPSLYSEAAKHPDIFFHAYVIDDSSPDGTAEIVKCLISTLVADNFKINLINRLKKEGLGKAYIDSFKYLLGLENPPNLVLQMDADLSHNPKYISSFITAALNGSDFVVGSRYIDGGCVPNWSWYRKFLSKGGNYYARAILGNSISDYTGGFNLYSLELLKKIDLNSINHQGYGFLINFKHEASLQANHIEEVPIEFLDREYGKSKMPATTIINNFLLVLSIKIKELITPKSK
jgi:dolichol-phosphate mannosyltransferase